MGYQYFDGNTKMITNIGKNKAAERKYLLAVVP